MNELFALFDRAGLFIGNDSGPGHLAALVGVPVLTLFGPQLPEWFAPLHPQAEWLEENPARTNRVRTIAAFRFLSA
jgi:ADP-heptose:LPS heptosyltransferase